MTSQPGSAIDWYERRGELEADQVFTTHDGARVMLDRRVPGDGSAWYAATWENGSWIHGDRQIEPGDLTARFDE